MRKRGRKKQLSHALPFLGELVHIICLDTHPCLRALLLLGIPQKLIADVLGINYRTVSSYVVGDRKLPQKHLEPLLILLEGSLQEWEKILESEDIEQLESLVAECHDEEVFADLEPDEQKRMKEIAYILTVGNLDLQFEYAVGVLQQEMKKLAAKE